MTGQELMGVVGFMVMLSVTLWGVWWKIQGQIDKAKTEASADLSIANAKTSLVQTQLADHKLHVAENYITKAGHRESTEHIMHAIKGVQQSVEGVAGRLDRVFEQRRPHDGGAA